MIVNLQIFLILGIFIYLGIILHFLRKKKMNLRYSLIWLFSAVILLMVTLVPGLVELAAKIIGIATPVNMVFVVEGVFVLLILISLTTIVSNLNEKNRCMIQAIAILEKRVRELEKNDEEKDE